MTSRRIVSLVPSLTETVCQFGLIQNVVGCTSFCVDPPELMRLATNVGGTKTPDLAKIAQLVPTHILTNDEENTAPNIKACEVLAPTFRCLPKSPRDVPKLLEDLSIFLNGSDFSPASEDPSTQRIRDALSMLDKGSFDQKTFLYLIWRNPWMAAGPDTYISRSLELIGWKNGLDDAAGRYPALTPAALERLNVDVVLTSSEPYPFRRRDVDALKADWPSCPTVWWCDGKLLSWFGTKTGELLDEMILFQNGGKGKLFKPH